MYFDWYSCFLVFFPLHVFVTDSVDLRAPVALRPATPLPPAAPRCSRAALARLDRPGEAGSALLECMERGGSPPGPPDNSRILKIGRSPAR